MEIQAERAIEKQTERKGLRERRFVPKRVTESVCEREREGPGTDRQRGSGGQREGQREGVGDRERDRERGSGGHREGERELKNGNFINYM